MLRAGSLGDGDGHEADDARAGDEDGLHTDTRAHDGVHRVAERVEDGGPLVGDVLIHRPDVRLGDHRVVGEDAVAVDAQDLHVARDMRIADERVVVVARRDVALGAHPIARLHLLDGRADAHDDAHELVAGDDTDGDSSRCPVVPLVDMAVGAAHARFVDADEHVVGSRLAGLAG